MWRSRVAWVILALKAEAPRAQRLLALCSIMKGIKVSDLLCSSQKGFGSGVCIIIMRDSVVSEDPTTLCYEIVSCLKSITGYLQFVVPILRCGDLNLRMEQSNLCEDQLLRPWSVVTCFRGTSMRSTSSIQVGGLR
jgi:hypothetical protein